MRITKIVLFGIAAIYTAAALVLYLKQRDLMFSAATAHVLPHEVGLVEVSEVTLTTQAGEKLYSWYGPAKPDKATILFFHGNGGSLSSRLDKFHQIMDKGYGIFMLGYPGYGGSEGSPSETAFNEAAELSYNYLDESGLEPSDLVLYGESLGTSVAVQLAARESAAALILEAPMSSILEIAQSQYPYVPLSLLLKDPFMSIDSIRLVNMPILFIHGTNDGAIPIQNGQALFKEALQPKTFHTVEGAGHNNLYEFPVVDVIDTFIEQQL